MPEQRNLRTLVRLDELRVLINGTTRINEFTITTINGIEKFKKDFSTTFGISLLAGLISGLVIIFIRK